MLVVMQEGAKEPQVQAVIDRLVTLGFTVHRSTGVQHTCSAASGPVQDMDPADFEVMDGVKECHRIVSPYKLASRNFRPGGTVVRVGDVEIGGDRVVIMAGPCSVESEEQIERTAEAVARAGAVVLRGGAFKPRSSRLTASRVWASRASSYFARRPTATVCKVISEVMDTDQISLVAEYADILQVGARNMQNFIAAAEARRAAKPVLLKRGPAATIEELLLSAEYLLAGGNYDVILCERGIRTFETYTRNTMDISAIPVVKKLSHLPIVADPSHGTGRRDKVLPMARAAVAAGADGLIIEVHHDPDAGAQRRGPVAVAGAVRRAHGPAPDHRSRRGQKGLIAAHADGLHCLGVGLIGGSFALALRRAGFDGRIIGVSSPRTVEEALAHGIIDEARPLDQAPPESDLVYLSQPITRILEQLETIGEHLHPGALVTDAGSTKVQIVETARRHIRNATFLGGHPMAGKETRGAAAADADLFTGRPYALTPLGGLLPDTEPVAAFLGWIRKIGARPVTLAPEQHDRLVALSSHLPQLASTALAATIAAAPASAEVASVAGPGLLDSTRLALSPFEIWSDIVATNREAIDEALAAYIRQLEQIRVRLGSESLGEPFAAAGRFAGKLRAGADPGR